MVGDELLLLGKSLVCFFEGICTGRNLIHHDDVLTLKGVLSFEYLEDQDNDYDGGIKLRYRNEMAQHFNLSTK